MINTNTLIWIVIAWLMIAFFAGIEVAFVRANRLAIELETPGETEAIVADRATRQAWLEARDYKVVHMRVADVERDLEGELKRLDEALQGAG